MQDRKKQKMLQAMLEVCKRKITEAYIEYATTGDISIRKLEFIELCIADFKNELRKNWN